MIAPLVINEIRRLLDQRELSQRMIARRIGVSRGTVNAIWLGKRPDRQAHRPEEEILAYGAGPVERCPGCGGKVQMPCLVCRVRSLQETRRLARYGEAEGRPD